MELLTTTQAAARLGISGQRVRLLCTQGRIKATKTASGYWLIDAEALAEYTPGTVGWPKGRKRSNLVHKIK